MHIEKKSVHDEYSLIPSYYSCTYCIKSFLYGCLCRHKNRIEYDEMEIIRRRWRRKHLEEGECWMFCNFLFFYNSLKFKNIHRLRIKQAQKLLRIWSKQISHVRWFHFHIKLQHILTTTLNWLSWMLICRQFL